MDVKINLNKSAIEKIKLDASSSLLQVADEVVNDAKTKGYIPVRTGNLEANTKAIKTNDGAYILSNPRDVDTNEAYAARVYMHPEWHGIKSANGRGNYLDSYLYGEDKDFIVNRFNEIFKSKGGS